ncbi:MAG TPA: hypothetical protein PLU17_08290 [Chitinophagaceae bacterium]|nr:hypothetical protein [Chitinophagaceae bacterium]
MKYILLFLVVTTIQTELIAQAYRTNNSSRAKNENNDNSEGSEKLKLGKNIISFSPIQIVAADLTNESPDITISLAYERIFNNELISIKLPVSMSLIDNYYYIMPTLKLYPKKQGLAKYAVGPQLFFGIGDGTYQEYYYNQSNGYTTSREITMQRKQFGFLINNSFNFTLAKSVYIGLDASLGIIYYDNLPSDIRYGYINYNPYTVNNSSISPAFQMNFCMGYRF